MSDSLQTILVIIIGGLFAPILMQLIENLYKNTTGSNPRSKPDQTDDKKSKKKKWLRFFTFAVILQMILFTLFFFFSKWTYFDKNYFNTSERELIKEGIHRGKDYIITKLTIRIYSESNGSVPLADSICSGKKIHYCSLLSISYDIVALKDYKNEKIFSEYYEALYANNVVKEPGSELEGDDVNPKDNICVYDVISSMKKYERKTITTRADYLYDTLPKTRMFFEKEFSGLNWDMFYYPNKEDDVIGEVEFQIISRSLKFKTPDQKDAVIIDAMKKHTDVTPQLVVGTGSCINFNIITAKYPRLKNNESFGIKWSW